MIEVGKYQIPQFEKVLASFKFPDAKSKHCCFLVRMYYELAYHQMIAHSENCNQFFRGSVGQNDLNKADTYLYRSWSHAFGMYVLLRTALETLSVMRKMIGDTKGVETYYKDNVTRIIDIANDNVKHPSFRHGVDSEACEPDSLAIGGEIDIITWSKTLVSTKSEIDPMKDFYTITNYIEYIAEQLKQDSGL